LVGGKLTKEISAGAVIYRRNAEPRYLLLKYRYKSEYWDFPKGNVEKGETLEETVRREVKEETGIEDIKLLPGFKEKISYFYKREGQTIYKEVVYFLAETWTAAVKISKEHIGFEWVDFETARERLKQNSRKVLEKANAFLTEGLRKFS
jgi:8-oxo-dGTP pyrophosphatase MutT (NUDIX family)